MSDELIDEELYDAFRIRDANQTPAAIADHGAPESLPELQTQAEYDAFVEEIVEAEVATLLQAHTVPASIEQTDVEEWIRESDIWNHYEFHTRYHEILSHGAGVDDITYLQENWRFAPTYCMAYLATTAVKRDVIKQALSRFEDLAASNSRGD